MVYHNAFIIAILSYCTIFWGKNQFAGSFLQAVFGRGKSKSRPVRGGFLCILILLTTINYKLLTGALALCTFALLGSVSNVR